MSDLLPSVLKPPLRPVCDELSAIGPGEVATEIERDAIPLSAFWKRTLVVVADGSHGTLWMADAAVAADLTRGRADPPDGAGRLRRLVSRPCFFYAEPSA